MGCEVLPCPSHPGRLPSRGSFSGSFLTSNIIHKPKMPVGGGGGLMVVACANTFACSFVSLQTLLPRLPPLVYIYRDIRSIIRAQGCYLGVIEEGDGQVIKEPRGGDKDEGHMEDGHQMGSSTGANGGSGFGVEPLGVQQARFRARRVGDTKEAIT